MTVFWGSVDILSGMQLLADVEATVIRQPDIKKVITVQPAKFLHIRISTRRRARRKNNSHQQLSNPTS